MLATNPANGKWGTTVVLEILLLKRIKKSNKKKERLKTTGKTEGPHCVSRQCQHIITAEGWFNIIKLMQENSSTLSNLCHICRYCQSKSISFTAQQITQSHKHLTLTEPDCQLKRLFSFSVYQSISMPPLSFFFLLHRSK